MKKIYLMFFMLAITATHLCAQVNEPPIVTPNLPFDMPARATLTSGSRAVFAHYFFTFPISASNKSSELNADGTPVDPTEYWYQKWLPPGGMEGTTNHNIYGGLVRDRHLKRYGVLASIPSPTKAGLTLTYAIQYKMGEVRDAITAGLDGFVPDILQVPQSATDMPQRWAQMLELMEAVEEVKRQDNVDFKIMIMPDGSTSATTNSTTLADAIKYLTDTYPATIYKREGKLVLAPFGSELAPANRNNIAGTDPVSPLQFWTAVLDRLRTSHGIPTEFWPCYTRDWLGSAMHPSLGSISAAASRWGDRDPINTAGENSSNRRMYYKIKTTPAWSTQKYMAPVSVGDERPNQGRFWERHHIRQLKESWINAIGDNAVDANNIPLHATADMVQIPTWSDFAEGAHVAPSQNHGWVWLDLNLYFMIRYKTGAYPTIVRDAVYLTHRIQPTDNEPTTTVTYSSGQTKFMNLDGGTPEKNTVGVVCFFTQPNNTVTLDIGGRIVTYNNVPAGMTILDDNLAALVPVGTGLIGLTATRGGATIANIPAAKERQVKLNQVSQDYSYRAASSLPSAAPDLVVTDISWSPSNPLPGQEISLKATIKNQGIAGTTSGIIHGVKFSVNGTTVNWSDTYTGSIAPGASITLSANGGPLNKSTWLAASGNNTVEAWVDDNNKIKESNETNNKYNEPLNINKAPVVSIISPSNNAAYNAPASIVISADASDADGSISKVEFYNGSALLGSSVTVPYNYSWTNVAAGKYSITVKAIDNYGAVTTSTAININVNQAPSVTIASPSNDAAFSAPATFTITAIASDVDGLISKVEFYNGSTLLGSDTTSPYNYVWSNVDSGIYDITAKATDNQGASSISSKVTITSAYPDLIVTDISWLPVAALPGDQITFKATIVNQGLVTTNAGVIHGVRFTVDGKVVNWSDTYISSLTAGASVTLTANSGPLKTSTWLAISGNHTVEAWVDDVNRIKESNESNNKISKSFSINQSPTVNITAPSNNATYVAPASFVISANAIDSDGTISKVVFYNGSTILGEDISSPYNYSWTSVLTGTYTITAKAIDNAGAVSTSSPITATVSPALSQGTGLTANYYDNMDYTGALLTRTDATVNFNWGSGAPAASMGADQFSVRWSGQVEAKYSETYTFYTLADDGVRLWVNGVLLIDNWVNQSATEKSQTITLAAGQRYTIRMDYFENGVSAVAQLLWSSATQVKQVIPQSQLYPSASIARTATISLDEPEEVESFLVYPNPAEDYLTITKSIDQAAGVEILLKNSYGIDVFSLKEENVSGVFIKTIDISLLPGGVYELILKTGEKDYVSKIVKQ